MAGTSSTRSTAVRQPSGDPARAPYVFDFSDGDGDDVLTLGGKGAGLARLVGMRLPVPPGFVVSCRAGNDYRSTGAVSSQVLAEIEEHLVALEGQVGRTLGDRTRPLLVSVRSGAPVSMPGMMDTVLNVGLTPATVEALATETGDSAFAWACYERFVESYVRIVRGIADDLVEDRLFDVGGAAGEERSRAVVRAMGELLAAEGADPVPDDPRTQILESVDAVFRSWTSPRAASYREFRGIDEALGTAAVVQAMVFGNRGDTSGSGVAFTRDPSTGDLGAFGDFLFNAQGEDVVAGTHDPSPLSTLGERLPAVLDELTEALAVVERHAGDLSEVEFTVDDGHLWILQTRVGQRSGLAAVRVAVAFADAGVISRAEAVDRVGPGQAESAGAAAVPEAFRDEDVLFTGLAASPGAVTGQVGFDVDRAVELSVAGEDVVLIRSTTSPGDVAGFIAARGLVTGRGGRTSHAAVVARGMGRPAVCGVGDVEIAPDRRSAVVAGRQLSEGERVSLDGTRGIVARGTLPVASAVVGPELERLISWAPPPAVPVAAAVARTEDASPDDETLVLDDPTAINASRATRRIAEMNAAGLAPRLVVSHRWAAAADRPLEGRCRAVVPVGAIPSLPLLVRRLRPEA